MDSYLPQSIFLSRTIDHHPTALEQYSRRSYNLLDSETHSHFHPNKNSASKMSHTAQLNRTIHVQKPSLHPVHFNTHYDQREFQPRYESITQGEKRRPKSQMVRSLRKQLSSAGVRGQTQLFDTNFEDTYNKFTRINFKRIAPKRIPLSFLKPQGKFSLGKSMEEVKSTLYQELERVPNYRVPQGQMIEYVTDYRQNSSKQLTDKELYKPKKCQNPSFLRQRLRSKIKEQSKKYEKEMVGKACATKIKKVNIVSI